MYSHRLISVAKYIAASAVHFVSDLCVMVLSLMSGEGVDLFVQYVPVIGRALSSHNMNQS